MSDPKILGKDYWRSEPLGNLCNITIGRTPSRSRPQFWNGKHHWLSIADMNQGRRILSTKEKITSIGAEESGSRLILKGTLVMSFKLSIGKVSITDVDTFTNEAIAALPILDTQKLSKGFLFWALKSIRLDEEVDAAAKGKTLNKAKLERLQIPLPPLDEQKRIAAVLDKVDALRRQRQESLQLTEDLLQSVFIDMFGDERSPKCPRVPLSEHLDFLTSGGRGWAKYYADEGDIFIRSLDVRMNEISDDKMVCVQAPQNAEAKRTKIKNGDVLLTITGSLIGRAAPVTKIHEGGYISQHVAILRIRDFSPEFVAWSISMKEGQQQISKLQRGQAKPGLNFRQIEELTIPRPTRELENAFCLLIQKRRAILSEQRLAHQQAGNLLSSLQQQAFRGELDLSRVTIEEDSEKPRESFEEEPNLVALANAKPPKKRRVSKAFRPTPAISRALKRLDAMVTKTEPIPWSSDYVRYRILPSLETPFTSDQVIQQAETVFESIDYDNLRELLFSLLGKNSEPALTQRFDLRFAPNLDGVTKANEKPAMVFERLP